jgi:hypothetical protein
MPLAQKPLERPIEYHWLESWLNVLVNSHQMVVSPESLGIIEIAK